MKFYLGNKKYELQFFAHGKECGLAKVVGTPGLKFSFHLKTGKEVFKGKGKRGDYSAWIPYSPEKGIKVIRASETADVDKLYSNIQYVSSLNSPIFPKVYNINKLADSVVVELENVQKFNKPKLDKRLNKFLPAKDFDFALEHLSNNLQDLNLCVREFAKHQLRPEDEWYKESNLINGKIVDFHWFERKPERYFVPSLKTPEECQAIYKRAVDRYQARGDNKWKGKIYQGFRFDNKYVMQGYTSDKKEFDSYRKLHFIPLMKAQGGRVFDFGCNEGFFSIQSALHGAKHVEGVDLVEEDVLLASEIREITGTDDVINFSCGDAIKALEESTGKFNLIVMNSVLHQIFPNMQDAGDLLRLVASKTDFFAYETPVNHPTMTIPLSQIRKNLRKYFETVRLLYVYDAYSSGYRANFVCYTFS